MTEREECGDLASLSFCFSFKNKRQFWVAFPLPTSLLQLLRTTQQLLCAASVLPQCQNPLEAWLLLSVVEFPCLIYSSRTKMNQHLSLTGIRGILVSLEGLTVAGSTRACWSTDSAVLSRAEDDFVMLWQQHSLQFKSEVWPVGRDHNRRGMIGKQGKVKERERQQFKKKKKRHIKSDMQTFTLHLWKASSISWIALMCLLTRLPQHTHPLSFGFLLWYCHMFFIFQHVAFILCL